MLQLIIWRSVWVCLAIALSGCSYDDSNRDADLRNARITLGNALFNDPHLSADGMTKCASCHIASHAYTDGRQVAVGVFGRTGSRNTPSLSALDSSDKDASFFWDGRRTQLNEAVLDPLTNPVEMGLHDQAEIVQRIQDNAGYRASFEHIFHHKNIVSQDIGAVLADYVRSLGSKPSAYDRSVAQGDHTALNARAQLGLALFSGKARCSECHLLTGKTAALTDDKFHRTGVGLDGIAFSLSSLTQEAVKSSLQGSAIGDRVATHPDEAQLGRFNVTREPVDIGLFRTPSLKGVANTAPYMHDGSVPTLEDAIDREIYYRSLQAGKPLNLSTEDRTNLKAFLESL